MGRRPSFFKIIFRNDFTRLLRLPPLFMQKYGSKFQKNMKLRIESGRTWDVKVKAMEDGLFCFSKGWKDFAENVGLKFGEFLVFRLNNGGYSLDVSVYQTSGCKKEFPRKSLKEKKSSPLYYEFVLKPHQKSRLTPMRSFVRAAGLMGKERVELVGTHRNQWVALDRRFNDALRLDFARGWSEFRTANRLVFGKTYSFQFKPEHNIIKVKEVKN